MSTESGPAAGRDVASGPPAWMTLIRRVNRAADAFISPEIRSQGDAERARAGMLIVQALTLAAIAGFSAAYQWRVGQSRFSALGLLLFALAIAVPFALRKAKSHVWVGGMLHCICILFEGHSRHTTTKTHG